MNVFLYMWLWCCAFCNSLVKPILPCVLPCPALIAKNDPAGWWIPPQHLVSKPRRLSFRSAPAPPPPPPKDNGERWRWRQRCGWQQQVAKLVGRMATNVESYGCCDADERERAVWCEAQLAAQRVSLCLHVPGEGNCSVGRGGWLEKCNPIK